MQEDSLHRETYNALTQRIIKRICFIDDATGNIIKYGDNYYIITCKHVADHFFNTKKKYVLINKNIKLYSDQLKYICSTNDDLDIAVILISDNQLTITAYTKDDFEIIDNYGTNELYESSLFILGFPEQLGFQKEGKYLLPWFSYMTLQHKEKQSNEDYLFVEYARESNQNINQDGLKTRLPFAPGLSGAFIFKITPFDGSLNELWIPSLAKIIAVQTSWLKNKYLKGTNVKYLFDLLSNIKAT